MRNENNNEIKNNTGHPNLEQEVFYQQNHTPTSR